MMANKSTLLARIAKGISLMGSKGGFYRAERIKIGSLGDARKV